MAKKHSTRKKITTIEGLAIAVHEGFEEMRGEFKDVKSLLQNLDRRVSALEMKVVGMYRQRDENKMHRLDVQYLTSRISKLEEKVFGK